MPFIKVQFKKNERMSFLSGILKASTILINEQSNRIILFYYEQRSFTPFFLSRACSK